MGTFGTADDPMEGLGTCYRMKIADTICGGAPDAGEPLERDIIAMSINTGSDVSNIQFDLQVCLIFLHVPVTLLIVAVYLC